MNLHNYKLKTLKNISLLTLRTEFQKFTIVNYKEMIEKLIILQIISQVWIISIKHTKFPTLSIKKKFKK